MRIPPWVGGTPVWDSRMVMRSPARCVAGREARLVACGRPSSLEGVQELVDGWSAVGVGGPVGVDDGAGGVDDEVAAELEGVALMPVVAASGPDPEHDALGAPRVGGAHRVLGEGQVTRSKPYANRDLE